MLPILTLVGRPNVGKSTLFNRLTRTRDALVADYAGLTRDRRYGIGRIGPNPYIVVDTGGLSGESTGVAGSVEQQIAHALAEADHLLFLVDARDGCTGTDLELAGRLRRMGKAIALVVNKTDHGDPALATAEFHPMGLGEPFAISATQGRGVRMLMERVWEGLPKTRPDATTPTPGNGGTRIAVVGRPNVGKSTLVNRLLGEERLVTCDAPGTTRDSIEVPFEYQGKAYTLIDTAGVRRRAKVREAVEKFSVVKTLQAIEQCNLVILVLDARQGIGEQDATLATHILDSGRALVVAVNKWDGLSDEERARVRDALDRTLGFLDFAAVHYISARHGSGVGQLPEATDRAIANATRDLGTPELTRILEEAVQGHPPPLVRGRRIKLRYAHQGGRNPPIIVIHGNQTAAVPHAYRRYLINCFRRRLDLSGTPLRLEFRTATNPYAGRRNRLTPAQQRKRARLKRYIGRRG
ncbi:ribosome biogenesis GTPase Der [Candidatus Thiosymbion oneisti]|uniref:ribosome biogenesis GTPase Der n=1 Tax=Candidatus Thiosymbion oneisti TaxID=589554 RepID=UPI000A467307|nr:ribosome biogenesis GTPase Der [Candidatus Thiosymbion oneisti]